MSGLLLISKEIIYHQVTTPEPVLCFLERAQGRLETLLLGGNTKKNPQGGDIDLYIEV